MKVENLKDFPFVLVDGDPAFYVQRGMGNVIYLKPVRGNRKELEPAIKSKRIKPGEMFVILDEKKVGFYLNDTIYLTDYQEIKE